MGFFHIVSERLEKKINTLKKDIEILREGNEVWA